MNVISKSIINIKFIKNGLFYLLDKEEKELFYEKYQLVYDFVPTIDLLSRTNRKNIDTGLMKAIVNGYSSHINSFYIAYFSRILDTPTGQMGKKVLYKNFFNNDQLDGIFSQVYDFINHSGFITIPTDEENMSLNDASFCKLLLSYRNRLAYYELPNKEMKEFYRDVLTYLLAYFVMRDSLINKLTYFNDLCNFFEDNFDFLYLYYTSNYDKKFKFIIDDLFNKYNNGLVKKMIK